MIALLLSVIASTLIFVIFKLFDRFKINIFHAIVVNYFVACACGLIAYNNTIVFSEILSSGWFYYTILLGVLFIVVFNLMALTTQKSGLSVVSVATKMSVVIPIIFGLIYYREDVGIFKVIGIILALVAVYLSSVKSKSSINIKKQFLILPVLVFLGSGIIDTSIKFLEESYVAQNDVALFSATIFGAAAIIGSLVIIYKILTSKVTFHAKNLWGGITLGIPNFFSVYFLVMALRSEIFDSSGIFTVNNVAVVTLSTIAGIILFKEKLITKNWLGVILAIISIFFIAMSNTPW